MGGGLALATWSGLPAHPLRRLVASSLCCSMYCTPISLPPTGRRRTALKICATSFLAWVRTGEGGISGMMRLVRVVGAAAADMKRGHWLTSNSILLSIVQKYVRSLLLHTSVTRACGGPRPRRVSSRARDRCPGRTLAHRYRLLLRALLPWLAVQPDLHLLEIPRQVLVRLRKHMKSGQHSSRMPNNRDVDTHRGPLGRRELLEGAAGLRDELIRLSLALKDVHADVSAGVGLSESAHRPAHQRAPSLEKQDPSERAPMCAPSQNTFSTHVGRTRRRETSRKKL